MKLFQHKRQSEYGFTLIELSIVLVIIGLIVGGVLVGRDLIRASELRSVITEYNRYVTAVATFRGKYNVLPGDMANATSYWGAQNSDPATCYTTPSTTQLTCNGDGNGVVDGIGGGDVHEVVRFWQHLSNAGVIEGRFSGAVSGCWIHMDETNSPKSKLDNSAFWGLREPIQVGGGDLFIGYYSHWLQLGALSGCDNYNPVLRPSELYMLDTKIDDGKPAAGKVLARAFGGLSTCTSAASASDYTATYLMNATGKTCAALFNMAF